MLTRELTYIEGFGVHIYVAVVHFTYATYPININGVRSEIGCSHTAY